MVRHSGLNVYRAHGFGLGILWSLECYVVVDDAHQGTVSGESMAPLLSGFLDFKPILKYLLPTAIGTVGFVLCKFDVTTAGSVRYRFSSGASYPACVPARV